MNIEFLENLEFSWTAVIEYPNGQKHTIWYTAFPMSKRFITKVISVSSDYPKHKIKK